jgi:superfamily II RNA helicase
MDIDDAFGAFEEGPTPEDSASAIGKRKERSRTNLEKAESESRDSKRAKHTEIEMKDDQSDTSEESSDDMAELDTDLVTPSGFDPDQQDIVVTEENNCVHEYIAPKGYERVKLDKSKPPAREYKFKLDTFQ